MAYTAVKLADVTKALASVTAAQKKYADAQAGSKTSQTAVTNAQKALDAANQKLQQLQSDFDSQKYLTTNAGYQNSLKSITAAEKARDTAQTKLDAATNKNRATLQRAYDAANKAVDTAYANKDKAQAAAEKAAYAPIAAQQTAVNKQQGVFDTAQQKYQTLVDSFQPLLDQRNDAINNVTNYAQTIKDSFGDVTNINDAKAVQTLLKDVNSAIGGAKIPELQDQFKSQLGDFDPIKAFNEKLPELQAQYKQNVELPTLDANQVDAALNRMGTNVIPRTGIIGDGNSIYIPKNQGRGDDLAQYSSSIDGLNLKSVNANILTGAALFGVYKDLSQKGKVGYTGDFNKAAQQAGVDISGMSKQEAYDAINEKGQGMYAVTTRGGLGVDPATGKEVDHWSALYKREGDQLVPATDANGQKVVQGFNATWHTPFDDFGTFIQGAMPAVMMALPFVLPGIGNAVSGALGNAVVSSAVAPTAFTVGAPAVTASAAFGATAVSAAANAATNAVLTKLINPDASAMDLVKAAGVSAVSTLSAGNSAKIVSNIGISADTVKQIADITKLSTNQVNDIIANGVAKTATAIATGDPNATTNIAASVAGQFVGSEAQNLVGNALKNADPALLNAAVSAAGNVANVVTQTAVLGGDVNAALLSAAPDILTESSKIASQTGKKETAAETTEKQATQEFPLDYTIGAKENFSNEARIFYEKAIEAGISEQDALSVASAMDAQKVNQYYGRQFGPELAALSPQTLQKIDSLNKLYPNATETEEEFAKWRKGYNEAIQSEIELGEQGKLSLNPDGQTYSDIETGSIYFKDAEGNWDVRKVSGGSGTSGQVSNVDQLGNVSSAAESYNLASLFSSGTSTPGAANVSLFGSGAATNVPDYAQANPDDFRLITRDVFRDYGLPENAFEIVNFDTVSPELKTKISNSINAKVAEKESAFNKASSGVFGGGGGGDSAPGGGVTSGGTTSYLGNDIVLSGGSGSGAGGINNGTGVEFGAGTGTGTGTGSVFGTGLNNGTGIGSGTGAGTGSGVGTGTGTGTGSGTGAGTGSGTGSGIGSGIGTGGGTNVGAGTGPTGPTGPDQSNNIGIGETPDTTWKDPLAGQASGTDFDYTKMGDQNKLLNPLLFSLAGFTQKQKTNKQSGSSSSPFSLLGLGTSSFGESDTSTDPMGSLEAMYSQPTAAEQFASNPLPMALPAAPTSQVPITPTYYDPLSTSSSADTQTQDTPYSQADDPYSFAQGGLASKHPAGEPQFYSQGGLGNMYVSGDGDGTSDDVPAMLANNEFVIPADVVSALGNGSSEAGAGVLENFMYEIRKHKQSHNPRDLPPQSKGPLEYLSAAMQKGQRA